MSTTIEPRDEGTMTGRSDRCREFALRHGADHPHAYGECITWDDLARISRDGP